MTPAQRTRPRRLAAALLAAVLAGCSGGGTSDVAVSVDGGSDGVVLVSGAAVGVRPGAAITVEHGGVGGGHAPVTHAFVGGDTDQLPPLFIPAGAGLDPNPAVWGQCRGGDPAAATVTCPIPPAEGPQRWDGRAYWSTGALLPGESREVPLAEDIAPGSYALVCALHPQLRVEINVGDEGDGEPPGEPVRVAAAVDAAQRQAADLEPGEVLAGVGVDGAYVARFAPAAVAIDTGDSVTWTATSRAPVDVVFNGGELDLTHTAAADATAGGDADAWDGAGLLRSGYLSADPSSGIANKTWTVTFTEPGTYTYASRFGAEFSGTVVVED